MSKTDCTHDWGTTGREDVHVDFPTKTKGRNVLHADYLRCTHCSQDGFRRTYSNVVYTWTKDQTQWEK